MANNAASQIQKLSSKRFRCTTRGMSDSKPGELSFRLKE